MAALGVAAAPCIYLLRLYSLCFLLASPLLFQSTITVNNSLHQTLLIQIALWFLFSLRIKKIGGAVLGLHCCARTFSSCSKSGLLSRCGKQASHSSGFPCCRAVVVALRLYSTGSVLWCTGKDVPWHMGSSPITDPTQVPCTGRRILSHWTTSKVQFLFSDQPLTDPGARLP